MEEFKMLFPEFLLLTLSFLLFIGVILYHRLYRSSLCIFFLLIFMELYTPACYYVLFSATEYVQFGVETLRLYMAISTLSFFAYSLILAAFQRVDLSQPGLRISRWGLPEAGKRAALAAFALGLAVVLLLYLFHYREGLPLYQAVFQDTKIERPDMTGGIPLWFTASAFLSIALPCCYFYYYQKRGFDKVTNLLLIGAVSLGFVLGGNKGFIVYWFIFLWVYLWKMKIDLRIVFAGAVSFVILAVIMSGGRDFSLAYMLDAIEYGLGRFFLTQGAMLVNRIEMILQGFQFDLSNISLQVFSFVYTAYGVTEGSAPTYYLGDLLIQFGFTGGFLLHLAVFAVLAGAARWLDSRPFSAYRTWLFFTIQYFLGMAAISKPVLYRFLLAAALFLMFSVFEKKHAGSQGASCQRRPILRRESGAGAFHRKIRRM